MKALLSDERTTNLDIDKALIYERNGVSKILLSNFPEIYKPMLNIETLIKKIAGKTQESIVQLPDISEIPFQTIRRHKNQNKLKNFQEL